jgi:hypothetical protein
VARKLGWPASSISVENPARIDFNAKTIRVERMLEEGKQVVSGHTAMRDQRAQKRSTIRATRQFINICKASKATILAVDSRRHWV